MLEVMSSIHGSKETACEIAVGGATDLLPSAPEIYIKG